MANFDEVLNFGNGLIVDVTLNGTQNADGSYTAIAASGSDGRGNSITGVAINVDGSDNKIWLNGPAGPNPVVDFGGLTVVTDGTPSAAAGSAPADINIYYDSGHYYEDTTPPMQIGTPIITCYCRGTLILTERGEVEVEALKPGDLVLTAAGEAKSINWIGRQTVSKRFADPLRAYPIRVRAGALADNSPSRDLFVSPDHALLVGGVMANAGALVNGTSITREQTIPDTFVYYHVELDDHSLILAEGAPAETFVDNDDRMGFDNWNEFQALYPQGKTVTELPYPRAKSRRQIPVSVRVALAERAIAVGAMDAAKVA
jgi:Hint domain